MRTTISSQIYKIAHMLKLATFEETIRDAWTSVTYNRNPSLFIQRYQTFLKNKFKEELQLKPEYGQAVRDAVYKGTEGKVSMTPTGDLVVIQPGHIEP